MGKVKETMDIYIYDIYYDIYIYEYNIIPLFFLGYTWYIVTHVSRYLERLGPSRYRSAWQKCVLLRLRLDARLLRLQHRHGKFPQKSLLVSTVSYTSHSWAVIWELIC